MEIRGFRVAQRLFIYLDGVEVVSNVQSSLKKLSDIPSSFSDLFSSYISSRMHFPYIRSGA
jgi:hypothetical protein